MRVKSRWMQLTQFLYQHLWQLRSRKNTITRRDSNCTKMEWTCEDTGLTGHCIVRTEGHETMPQFVGSWFPRNDVKETYLLYYACMLALLSPWNKLQDIKGRLLRASFKSTYHRQIGNWGKSKTTFNTIMKARMQLWKGKKMYSTNSQLTYWIYKWKSVMKVSMIEKRELGVSSSQSQMSKWQEKLATLCMRILMDLLQFKLLQKNEYSKKESSVPLRPGTHILQQAMIFANTGSGQAPDRPLPKKHQMANLSTKKRVDPNAQTHSQSNNESNLQSLSNTWSNMSSLLKEDQLWAHNIVNDHLTSHLNGKQQLQLLMLTIEQGGTRKTVLNNSITKFLKKKKRQNF